MAIKVTMDEDGPQTVKERCALCGAPTDFWYLPKDVAVCQCCATNVMADQVPDKKVWLEKTSGVKLPDGWMCEADRRALAAVETSF
jgi:hypothetical protein